MFSLDLFLEIQIVGMLVLFAVSPIFIRFIPALNKKEGFFAGLDRAGDKAALSIAMLVLSFVIGVSCNLMLTALFNSSHLIPGDEYSKDFAARAERNSQRIKSQDGVELTLGSKSEAIRSWIDRHKYYIRILRGAVFASLLFLLSMAFYRLSRPAVPRYSKFHFITTLLLLVLFFYTYWAETMNYKRSVFELYDELYETPLDKTS